MTTSNWEPIAAAAVGAFAGVAATFFRSRASAAKARANAEERSRTVSDGAAEMFTTGAKTLENAYAHIDRLNARIEALTLQQVDSIAKIMHLESELRERDERMQELERRDVERERLLAEQASIIESLQAKIRELGELLREREPEKGTS